MGSTLNGRGRAGLLEISQQRKGNNGTAMDGTQSKSFRTCRLRVQSDIHFFIRPRDEASGSCHASKARLRIRHGSPYLKVRLQELQLCEYGPGGKSALQYEYSYWLATGTVRPRDTKTKPCRVAAVQGQLEGIHAERDRLQLLRGWLACHSAYTAYRQIELDMA